MREVLRTQVAVIGAGPAGAAAAVALAEAGVAVTLFDRARFPRDKVCGDGLLPDAFAPLARLGVLPQVRERAQAVRGIAFQTPAGARGFVPVEGLVMAREALDALLLQRARAAGATVVEGALLEEFDGEPGAWRAALFCCPPWLVGLRVEAQHFVLATGASPRPRQLAGLRGAPRPGAAVRAYGHVPALAEDELLVRFQRQALARGYYWAFPLGDGRFNLGCGVFASRPGDPSLVAETHRFAAELGAVDGLRKVRGAPLQAAYPRLEVAKGNILAVGDAAGLTRPFSGEGIATALESGLLAAAVLCQGKPDPARVYTRTLRGRFAREFAAYRWGERLLGWPWLMDALVRRVEASSSARARVKAVLAAHAPPAAVLSVRGLGRLLLAR